MLRWLFKNPGKVNPTPAASSSARAARPAAAKAAPAKPTTPTTPAAPTEQPAQDWPARLLAAQGDDAALLQLAQTTPLLEIKLGAVAAMSGESALKQAEREFRSHDRKVHRLAKQRWEASVAQRTARSNAQGLLERMRALLGDADVAVNHVVALERDWDALGADLLEPDTCAEFAELRTRLASTMRERGEAQQRLQRWANDAKRFMHDWPAAAGAAAQHGTAQDAGSLGHVAAALRQSRPPHASTEALDLALAQAQLTAQWLCSGLAKFEAPALGADELVSAPVDAPAQAPVDAPVDAPVHALPRLEPASADSAQALAITAELQQWLDHRQAQRWLAQQPSHPAPPAPAAADVQSAQQPTHAAEVPAALRLRLEALMQQAESALAEGQLGAMQRPLQAIEGALAKTRAALPEALRARHQALWAERDRLKAWQQWGGARARGELLAQAEELAQRTLAAAEPAATNAAKLNLKLHGQSIHDLRLRWKELDHQGDVASADEWQRFDIALTAAHEPVAAQHAAVKAARQANLLAREAMLAEFEARPEPEAALQTGGTPDWKEQQRGLEHLRSAWRKLGPLEHTVPAAAREPLQQRLTLAMARVEAPLQQAQELAAAQRERLIARAEALASQAGAGRPMPDAGRQVRDLQAEWQEHARRLPLPRGIEVGLWHRFKAATDAVFAQRDAAHAAREAELASHLAAREALLTQLSSLDATAPLADIERTLAQIDRAWRNDGELPRGAGDKLEARFRAARAGAAELLTSAVRKRWLDQCDSLAAKLALCEEREDGAEAASLHERWAGQGALPGMWEQALAQRWAQPAPARVLPATDVNDLLLRLEAALDMPAPPERQAARHNLKLRALKDAMEGRAPWQTGPAQQAEWLWAVLRQPGLDAPQRGRRRALLAALRAAPAGALGSPTHGH